MDAHGIHWGETFENHRKLTRRRALHVKHMALAALVAVAALPFCSAHAAGMTVYSSAFADGATIPRQYAGPGECGGKGQAFQVSWINLPAGARSVAVTLFDPDGAKGMGVSHWIVYNIDATRSQLVEGEGQEDGKSATLGTNSAGAKVYRGPCPPAGDIPHHYVLTVIALDLPPDALPGGLDRAGLMAAVKGHTLGGMSIVGRYAR